MLKEQLAQREYIPIPGVDGSTAVSSGTWEESRLKMRSLLEKYSYGITPDVKVSVEGTVKGIGRYNCAGKCEEQLIEITYKTEYGEGSFPIQVFKPVTSEKPPVLLHIAFCAAPDRYIPVEEIIDHGYALVVVDYRDMVNDEHHGDFSGGIAAHFGTTSIRRDDEWGKIGMWAWGTSRILDYLIAERDDMDTEKVAVIGHSRLGKTALWCGALDTRFAAVITDAGMTEFHGVSTKTCLALEPLPSEIAATLTGSLPLY